MTREERDRLPKREFVFPNRRAYPIPDARHAEEAIDDVRATGQAWERDAVYRKVKARFPHVALAKGLRMMPQRRPAK